MCQSSCGTSIWRPWWWGCRDNDAYAPERKRPQPRPGLLGWRAPFELWTPVTPPPPAAVLQSTSSTEQLLRMYNGNILLQPASCVSTAFTPQTASVNSEHTAPLYSPWPLMSRERAGGRLRSADLYFAGFCFFFFVESSLIEICMLVFNFLQHAKS